MTGVLKMLVIAKGSDATAACGGNRELSEC